MTTTAESIEQPVTVHRIEIWPAAGEPDPQATRVMVELRAAGYAVEQVRTAHVYLIESTLDAAQVQRVADELLGDPISQVAHVGVREYDGNTSDHGNGNAQGNAGENVGGNVGGVEVHYLPGVMDPVAQSTVSAIDEMLGVSAAVRTGTRYDIVGTDASMDDLKKFAAQRLANPVIQEIHDHAVTPDAFAHGSAYVFEAPGVVALRELDDDQLKTMSRDAHLFLSVEEMRAIRDYYRQQDRDPTDIELETLAQTWSEHCVHKTLKSTVKYTSELRNQKSSVYFHDRPGHEIHDDGSVTIHNLLKSTIAAATFALRDQAKQAGDDWLISVFDDNAGIIRFDDKHGVCIKVETHNHPSAIEPYGGAATGIGGCIRDVLGTGLAARPIANTNVFAVADPNTPTDDLPTGVIHPRRTLEQVSGGVRDYGNRMGIPTVNGAVLFHEGYLANPLVFAGCLGVMPIDKCFGDAQPGDRIVALGGRTGRDGIHGATFSSAELTDTHADEFSHAVQIGNAITQKKMLDVILQARDYPPTNSPAGPTRDGDDANNNGSPDGNVGGNVGGDVGGNVGGCLFSAITDCGAGGFSSAVGEMGEKVGATVTLETAPLKYDGLSYTEIWISEAQERMVLSVPPENIDQLQALCDAEDVELCDLGEFGRTDEAGNPELLLTYRGHDVGRLSMGLLHDGVPMPTRAATWPPPTPPHVSPGMPKANEGLDSEQSTIKPNDLQASLMALLAHPNIASKHWIIRQYDHEVQGGSTIKPLVGPQQDGPGDAAVVRPVLGSRRGVAIGCGVAPLLADSQLAVDADPYWMTLAAIDEAVRNVVCVGADPTRIAILDNFCWPSCDNPGAMATLVHACEACYDGAMAYGTPFVSGKDSLNNQFTTEDGKLIAIPPTLLVTAMAIVNDVKTARTMDAKQSGNRLIIVGPTTAGLGGSHYAAVHGPDAMASVDQHIPRVDLALGPVIAKTVAELIAKQAVASAHDCSDGGLLVAAAEMAFAGRVGLDMDLAALPTDGVSLPDAAACFAETPSRYLLEIAEDHLDTVAKTLDRAKIPFAQIGTFTDHDRLTLRTSTGGRVMDVALDELRNTWLKPLDW